MIEEPHGKRGRSQRLGPRTHGVSTTFDEGEWGLFERAVRQVGREGYTHSHKLRLAAVEWARHVLAEEEKQ